MAKVTLFENTSITPQIELKKTDGSTFTIDPYRVKDVKTIDGQTYVVYDDFITVETQPGVFEYDDAYIPIPDKAEFMKGLVEQVRNDTNNLRMKLQTFIPKKILQYDAEENSDV